MTALSNKIQQIAEKEYPYKEYFFGKDVLDGNSTKRKLCIEVLTKAFSDKELLELAMKELNLGIMCDACGKECEEYNLANK